MFNGIEWDEAINILNVRQNLKKGEITEILVNDNPCLMVNEHKVFCNDEFVETYFIYDCIVFLKLKKAV